MARSRTSAAVLRARERADAARARGEEWVESRDEHSRTGVAIGAWRRYKDVDGPLQSLALTTYILIAVVPALLVVVEYIETRPAAFATHLVSEYDLSKSTATLVRSVLVEDSSHKLGSALFAIAGALFFGLNFGKVIQLVHIRAWRLELRPRAGRPGSIRLCSARAVWAALAAVRPGGVVPPSSLVGPGWALSPVLVVLLLVVYFCLGAVAAHPPAGSAGGISCPAQR